jgi:hypothetical protein
MMGGKKSRRYALVLRSLFFRKKEVWPEFSRERRLSRAQQDESGTATAKGGVGSAVVAPITCRLNGARVSAAAVKMLESASWEGNSRDVVNYFGG